MSTLELLWPIKGKAMVSSSFSPKKMMRSTKDHGKMDLRTASGNKEILMALYILASGAKERKMGMA